MVHQVHKTSGFEGIEDGIRYTLPIRTIEEWREIYDFNGGLVL